MQEKEKLKLDAGGWHTRPPLRARAAARHDAHGKGSARGGRVYLAVRVGLAALLMAGALVIKLAGGSAALSAMTEPEESRGEGERAEETLGRLKFVELPSIAEVFAAKPSVIAPCRAVGTERVSSAELVFLTERGSPLVSPVRGRVSEMGGEGEEAFIRIIAEDGSEFTLKGVSGCELEPLRPVEAGQMIGSAASPRVTVRVTKNGMPLDPAAVFKAV